MKFAVIFKTEFGHEIVKVWAKSEREARHLARIEHPDGAMIRAYKLNCTGKWS